jgi:hypothetical protein
LLSLHPVNKSQGPRNAFEREALEALMRQKDSTRNTIVGDSGSERFVHITADIAGAQACVTCHNQHPDSTKRDYRLGDVMGGLIIEIPIGKEMAAARHEASVLVLGLAVGFLAILIAVWALLHRFVLRPLGAMSPLLQRMAQENADLSI